MEQALSLLLPETQIQAHGLVNWVDLSTNPNLTIYLLAS